MNETQGQPVPPAPQAHDAAAASRADESTPALSPTNQTAIVSHVPFTPNADIFPSLGVYSIIRKLGEGGMGVVYLAEDTKLGRKVALKLMKPELAANKRNRDRFIREARAAAAVEHDNIVSILHIDEAVDGTPFIAMPLLQGEMLDARLGREPVASLGLILKVAREVADGLAAAHARGVIHRDIKPSNIWLEGDLTATELTQQIRRCKILDFGLARSVNKDGGQITASGAILGTPAFMAPEQACGEKVDARADLFSLGATLFRMATGKLPFDGPTPMAILIALTTEPPPSVRTHAPTLPPALADLIDRLMSKDLGGRPHSAAEVAAAVRQIIQELKARRTPATPTVRSHTPPRVPQDLLDRAELAEPVDATQEDAPDPPRASKRNLLPWVIAVACGLLALVPIGLWRAGVFGEKKADTNMAKKEDMPKGGTPKTGKANEDISPRKDNEGERDSDRAAATYILSHGGGLVINGDEEHPIMDVEVLPKESFHLTGVRINNRPISDQGLAAFKNCTNLEHLDIGSTAIGDTGLAHFSGCQNLRHLDLGHTRVTDASIATIKQFKKLKFLQLEMSEVTAKGIAELKEALPKCEIQGKGTTKPE